MRACLRRKKRQHRSEQHRKVEGLQGKALWNQLRSMFDAPGGFPEVVRRPDGTTTAVHAEKVTEAKRYFERLGSDHRPPGTFDDAFARTVRSQIRAHQEESRQEEPHDVLDQSISLKEVHGALHRLRTQKCPGPDRIHNEMLKRGGDALAGALHRLFSHMWRTERWPEQWQAGRITAIHKGGDKEELDNYRGITLLSSIWCEQVKEGGAKGSLCAEYRDLLLKHDLGSQWEELPPDPRQWTDWDTRVHKVVALRDLADRKVRLTERESMARYLMIKPMDKPSRSAYLYGRGLGVL